jgi:hypothetical protein
MMDDHAGESLATRLLPLLDAGVTPVTADEAIERASSLSAVDLDARPRWRERHGRDILRVVALPGQRGHGLPSTARARLRAAAVAVLLGVVLAFVLVGPLPRLHLGAGPVTVPTTGSTTVPSPPTTSSPPSVSNGPWPQSVIARVDIAPGSGVLAPGPTSSSTGQRPAFVLGFEINGCLEPCSEPIVRLDPSSGSIAVGPVVSALSRLAVVGSSVVLLTASEVGLDGHVTGGWALRTVDVTTLQLGPRLELGFLGDGLAFTIAGTVGGTKDLWLAGTKLWLVDTSSGRLVRQVNSGGFPAALLPDGRTLYDITRSSGQAGNEIGVLSELDATTGRVLASVEVADPFQSATLTAVADGVFVATDRSVDLFSSRALRPVNLAPGAVPPDPVAPNRYLGFGVYALGSFTLIESYRGMTCLSPTTSSLRATALWSAAGAPTWTPIAAIGHTLLAGRSTSFTSSDVFAVRVPAACLD